MLPLVYSNTCDMVLCQERIGPAKIHSPNENWNFVLGFYEEIIVDNLFLIKTNNIKH